MTYDLHGQWDYNSKWSMPGCGGARCLRSHINTCMTETVNTLSMITKAGVPSSKIVVGMSSYGRSFQMTKAGCDGPQCGFTGPASTAKKGRCTNKNGYISNAEIDEILRSGKSIQKFYTDRTESQILVYDSTQWVAYMTADQKEKRRVKWQSLNFAGTTDWAVDLEKSALGDNNADCWQNFNCMSDGATNTTKDMSKRWHDECGDQAWNSFAKYWEATKGGSEKLEGFAKAVANFFHFPMGMDCGSLVTANGSGSPRNANRG